MFRERITDTMDERRIATPVPNRRRVGYANRSLKRKRCKRANKIVDAAVPNVLQELYASSRDIFKGPGTVPSLNDVKRLCQILDNMKPEDVGLTSKLPFFNPKTAFKGTPRVSCTTIYKSDNFSLCMFFLPANGVIPLHNHPGMTVFSKLLVGTMHIKSYDWVDPLTGNEPIEPSKLRLAKLIANEEFTAPCSSSVLYPTMGGNIHQCRAITPCAFLDVLGPPYSKEDGRDCSYYKDFPYHAYTNGGMRLAEQEASSYGWLEEIDMPDNSDMDVI
ncbi:hypothetical protein K2173_025597 [Erythroxylum novogranatense]|uniref:cysteine dioxygenase n=1 Tax=Erythroxylum novogranatense TaxID=1862640 RepID=A0AAV8T8T7_9ROSI|nr:hypothetical protein K2173_025597 [Erythroxylum novogranatense]